MVTTTISLTFNFESLSSPLLVALSYQQATNALLYCLSYNGNSVDITYQLSDKTGSASWQASAGHPLSLKELLSLAGVSALDQTGNLDIDLQRFSLTYNETEGLIFFDIVTSSGSNAFIAAVRSQNEDKKWQLAAGFYLSDTLSLKDIPLVGKEFGNQFYLKNIHLAYLAPGIDSTALSTIEQCLQEAQLGKLGTDTDGKVVKGISAGATFSFDKLMPERSLVVGETPPAGPPGNTTAAAAQTPATAATATAGIQAASSDTPASPTSSGSSLHKQFSLNKSIGPVYLRSVGMGYQNSRLEIDITASIATGPVSISLDGLGITNPLTRLDPGFRLDGLGIDFQSGPLTLGGALLRADPPPQGVTYEYNGMLNFGLEAFQLEAFGSYAKMNNGDTSLFMYAVADYPLGGPAFFFVTGLAAGFGYNRNLIAPDVSQVASYPLVAAASNTSANKLPGTSKSPASQATEILTQLNQYIPPDAGEYFAGIGVKFESFKIIDSFALLIAKFGKELAFDFFAVSTYTAPAPSDPSPVAVVELEVLGQFIPSQGYAMIQGQLTPASFLLDKNCHLTGGFAVGLWATGQYAGDFVYTFGGYGSHFKPPAHYPQQVPVIGLNWQISSDISVKGGLYWAITPQIVAAGGYMHAAYNASFFRAWFDMDAYFLIQWKPFHYMAGFHVDFGLKVRVDLLFTSVWLGFDIGANLTLQGPPFGGTASISLSVCTIHIHFGSQPSIPLPLYWTEFDQSFLPQKEARINIRLISGLIKTVTDIDGNSVWVINAKELCIETNSFIPSSDYQLTYQPLIQNKPGIIEHDDITFSKPGIKPMSLAAGSFTSKHQLMLTGPDDDCGLKATALLNNVPKAIWGDTTAGTDQNALLTDTLSGFRLQPANGPKAGITHSVNRNALAWELDVFSDAYQLEDLTPFSGQQSNSVLSHLKGTNTARQAVLSALGMQDKIPALDSLQASLNFNFLPTLITGRFGGKSI